jgi:predicted nucleic acid-binding protein
MRQYLLDTGPIVAFLNGRPLARQLIGPWIDRREATTTTLNYAEVVELLRSFPDFSRRQTQLKRELRGVHTYCVSIPAAEHYAVIRRHLRPPHGPGLIGDVDTFVAAVAIEHGLTVVTTDSDFARVPGLNAMIVSFKP